MKKPRYKDDNGEWVYVGDAIYFRFGIPPMKMQAKIESRDGSLWVVPIDDFYSPSPLRSLRGYVGEWYREDSKTCTWCNTVKLYTEFNRCHREKDGHKYQCRQCDNEYKRLLRQSKKLP